MHLYIIAIELEEICSVLLKGAPHQACRRAGTWNMRLEPTLALALAPLNRWRHVHEPPRMLFSLQVLAR
eukprot:4545026-Pleurochrysis_carterae.AAC.1